MANRGPSFDSSVFSIRDLQNLAWKDAPICYREYFDEGAMDMVTLKDNIEAYNRYRIWPRILRNVSQIDTSGELVGQKTTFPLGLSPTAMHKLAHPDGELATSRAAANMGVGMCLSSYSNTSLEEVILQGRENPYMMQMCVVRDRRLTKQLLERAEGRGYRAIVLSVDCPVLGRRLNEFRNDFTLPANLGFPNILSSGEEVSTGHAASAHEKSPTSFDDALEWLEIIPWLKQNTQMQIWLKGVLSPADVELAIKHSVDGIIISNHGGRQLDQTPATLDALRACAPMAKGRIRIAVDGGIRRGSDIFKALALGAEHCFIGRIVIWGLAYKGQQGVELALKILLEEFRVTMALAGCRSVREIKPEHVTYLEQGGLLAKL